MKRIVIFKNGSNVDGKLVLVTHSLGELLATSSQKLGIVASQIYTERGGLVDDISLIRDDDVLYVSSGEAFVPPRMSGQSNTRYFTDVTSDKIQTGLNQDSSSDIIQICNNENTTKHQDWVSLNVGGRIFTTTRSTLVSKQPNSMLAKMFGEGDMIPSMRDRNGAFLIDRSYTYFEPILNYLRSGNIILDNNINVEGVLEEARFYGIESMIAALETMVEQSNPRSREEEPLSRRDVLNALLTTKPKSELRFQAVDLCRANLSKLDLRNINFKYADLSESNLSGANLSGCCLERSNLSKAILDSAQLLNVKLLCANLEGASLKSCNFEDPAGTRANCEGVNLRGAVLEGSMMAGVNLRVATLKNANLKNCDLRAAILAGADLENCDLSGSDLQEANLRGANLKHAAFELMQTPLHMSQTCGL